MKNEIIIYELNQHKICVVKSNKFETCDSLRGEIEDLYKTLSKFTKGKYNLDMIPSNQIASYSKSSLGYQPDSSAKSFMIICLAEKKKNHTIYKWNYCHRFGQLEPYYFKKM